MHVTGVRGPFVLALADAFSHDWHVHGLPHGASAHQVEIDGYRNGWTVDARGDLDLTIAYGPARYGRDALRISELTAVALIGSLLFGRRRRRVRALVAGPSTVIVLDADLPAGPRRVLLSHVGMDLGTDPGTDPPGPQTGDGHSMR